MIIRTVFGLALSRSLSLAWVSLIGLVPNSTPGGVGLFFVSLLGVFIILAMVVIVFLRRWRSLPVIRREPGRQLTPFSLLLSWRYQSVWRRMLAIILALAILGTLGSLTYVIAKPKAGERFTEFYMLGLDGKAEGYPQEITLGDEAKVELGIVNEEGEPVVYRIEITINGEKTKDIGHINLDDGQRWEGEIGFQAIKAGRAQLAEFLLYKEGVSEAYRSLYLWVDVKGGL